MSFKAKSTLTHEMKTHWYKGMSLGSTGSLRFIPVKAKTTSRKSQSSGTSCFLSDRASVFSSVIKVRGQESWENVCMCVGGVQARAGVGV